MTETLPRQNVRIALTPEEQDLTCTALVAEANNRLQAVLYQTGETREATLATVARLDALHDRIRYQETNATNHTFTTVSTAPTHHNPDGY